MKAGNRIRIDVGSPGLYSELKDFTVEEFRFCLGIFIDEDHRKAAKFTPICDLYEEGPESIKDYIPNFGPYKTNMVPRFMYI